MTILKEESTEVPTAFSILSDPLKDAISAELTGSLLRNCTVFTPFDSTFLANIGKKLQAEAFAPDDLVFESGQICGKMYFVTSGAVEIYHEGTGSTFTFLKRGEVFGEIGFFLGWPRCASSRCIDYSDLLSLDRVNVEPLLNKYPDAQKHFTHLAMQAHSSHDLSCLSIYCYLCEGLGHVAIHCKESVFQRNKTAHLLQSRHTKYINKAVPPLPNYVRKDKHALRRISAANVIGGKRSPADMYPEDSHLYPLITEFEETLERERVRSTTTELTEGDRGRRIHFNLANFADSFNEEDPTSPTPQRTHTLHTAKVVPWLDRSAARAGTFPNPSLPENK
jgi:CRP-like cAMP-binding protein